jgi:glycosyltransferase involved in cell wall biosynthesis
MQRREDAAPGLEAAQAGLPGQGDAVEGGGDPVAEELAFGVLQGKIHREFDAGASLDLPLEGVLAVFVDSLGRELADVELAEGEASDLEQLGAVLIATYLDNVAPSIQPAAVECRVAGRIGGALNPYHHFLLAAERRLFGSARLRAVICNSKMVRDEIRCHFGTPAEKLHVVYNGVDLDAFNPTLKSQRSAVRSEFGIAPDTMVYLFVGSGFERKGLPQLLRALSVVPAAHLIVVGGDKRQKDMQRLRMELGIAPRVHFAGPQKDVKRWYGAADCFVLPTLYDPFPNAALEAMASGLPVITTSQCGAAEFVEEGVGGMVCEAGDVVGLSLAMRKISEVAGAEAMGRAARAAVSGLGTELMAAQLAALYRSLMPNG